MAEESAHALKTYGYREAPDSPLFIAGERALLIA